MAIVEETAAGVIREARVELAAALRAAALYGFNEGIDNHFSFAVPGSDVAEAWQRLYFLERACQVQVLAHSTGRPVIAVSDEIARRTGDNFVRDHEAAVKLFASVRRRLDRETPGYDA